MPLAYERAVAADPDAARLANLGTPKRGTAMGGEELRFIWRVFPQKSLEWHK